MNLQLFRMPACTPFSLLLENCCSYTNQLTCNLLGADITAEMTLNQTFYKLLFGGVMTLTASKTRILLLFALQSFFLLN